MNFSWVNRKTLRHASCQAFVYFAPVAAIWINAIWSMYKLTLIFNNTIKLESSQNNHSTTSSTILLWTEWVTWLRHMTKNVSLFLKASIFTFYSTTQKKNIFLFLTFVIFPFQIYPLWTISQCERKANNDRKWCAFKRKVLVWTRPKLFSFQ